MTYHPDRSQQAAQQAEDRQSRSYEYEPQPLSLHDDETLPDNYPAFYNEQTFPAARPQARPLPTTNPVLTSNSQAQANQGHNEDNSSMGYPASVYPPVYRQRPFLPWLLIAVGALSGILLLAGLGFAALNTEGIHLLPALDRQHIAASSSQNAGTSATALTDVVSSYYNAIEQQNYAQAYKYLHVNTLASHWNYDQPASQDLFAQQASYVDNDAGVVTNYSVYHIYTVDSNYARAVLGVNRGNYYYHVSLDLRMIDGAWRVVQFNRI